MSPPRLTFAAALLALVGVLALGAWSVPRVWLADGVPIRQPIDLTRAGLTRLVVQQPVDTIVVMELSFGVARDEWTGPLPGDADEAALDLPADDLALEYGLIVRDAGGGLVTARRGSGLRARLGGGTTGRSDVAVFAWLTSFGAMRGAEYDVAIEVAKPVGHPRAATAELTVLPIRRTTFQRLPSWLLTALWTVAVVALAVVLVRLWAAARSPR